MRWTSCIAFRPSAQLVRSDKPLENDSENANTLARDGGTLEVLAHLQK